MAPQVGQAAVFDVGRATITSRLGSASMCSMANPDGANAIPRLMTAILHQNAAHIRTGFHQLCDRAPVGLTAVSGATGFPDQAAWRTRARSRSCLARPYICRL